MTSSYGASYNPAHPNFWYTVDGIRVPVESFVAFAGVKLRDPLGLLVEWARDSEKQIGGLKIRVSSGDRSEIIYDANGRIFYKNRNYIPALSEFDFELEFPIYGNTAFDPTLLPQTAPQVKNATPELQTRFNEAYTEFWKRLHANDGKNACAELFGGIKKAENALKNTTYVFGYTSPGTEAVTKDKTITIKPNGVFISTSGSEKLQIGVNLRANQGHFVALNNVEAAAFILAHEIGHRVGTLRPDGHDKTNFVSVINNEKVYEACFSDLPTVIGPATSGIE